MTIIAINLHKLRSGGTAYMYYISSLTECHPANGKVLSELNDLATIKQTTTSGIRHLEIKLGMQCRERNISNRRVHQTLGHYWDLSNEWFLGKPIPNASAS
ncbi:hypothetical protein PV05_00570 [Exophiala xenobiotica]|uniref:Uncharacterized protein n=1 Tax=Exophiala xenobiotica TaxID=348802 RepID=A0A0D2EX70_9EURO|nr:uncharacterized protein PV05_00570 [Exophiala xenobiotica]KIW60343.1 hypothetical protein PV05_00570 [Exophiala xenobiotica]